MLSGSFLHERGHRAIAPRRRGSTRLRRRRCGMWATNGH
eukprot:gene3700-biopygen3205